MNCKAGTIGQIHKKLVEDGYCVSQYALRKWVKDGSLPSVRSGKKFFIVYEQVLEFLTTGKVELKTA